MAELTHGSHFWSRLWLARLQLDEERVELSLQV